MVLKFSPGDSIPQSEALGDSGQIRWRAIENARRIQFVTFDRPSELTLPYADRLEPEDIEVRLEALSIRGIKVTEASRRRT